MRVRKPLLPRVVAFIAGTFATLSVGAFLINRSVTRSGLEDLFRQRLMQSERVLDQYLRTRAASRAAELESVLTSPRFLAAVETRDPATIGDAVPTHALLAESDFLVLLDAAGGVLHRSAAVDDATLARLARLDPSPDPAFVAVDATGEVREVTVAPLVANNGAPLGSLILGDGFGRSFAEDLRALTGFEVLVANRDRVLARSAGFVADLAPEQAALVRGAAAGTNVAVDLGGRRALVHRVEDPATGVSISFLGSVDDAIAPIMARTSALLLLMTAVGASLSVGVVYLFAKRRVVRQVASLARSAERIADGDLDFEIRPESEDELGYVAAEFERMRAQLRTGRAALEAAHAERVNSERVAAIGRMATGIIHDFKNPMAVVLGTADLIRSRDPDNPKLARQCDVICRQIDRMSALTRDVLEFARGRTVLEPEEVDLRAWLAEVVDGHREAAERAGQRVALECPDGPRVIVDPGRLRRVLDNLLTNAREASRVGDLVTLRARVRDDGGVLLEVQDEGAGIPPEIAATLFEPFVTAGKEGGSGLGLAISRKIVEDHGAGLTVASAPGAGACFRIELPAKLRAGTPGTTEREEVGAS